jgi:hypothetical protein
VEPVPDPLLLKKFGSAGNRTCVSGSVGFFSCCIEFEYDMGDPFVLNETVGNSVRNYYIRTDKLRSLSRIQKSFISD